MTLSLKSRLLKVIILLLLILIFFIVSIKYLYSIESNNSRTSDKSIMIAKYIHIKNLAFDTHESTVKINVGDTIEFKNNDEVRHTIISTSPYIPNSRLLYPKDKFHITFWVKGTYSLFSSLYNNMKPINIVVS